MTEEPAFSILVNTSDGFEDCWEPFFCLFNIHWSNCDFPIILNTEKKNWSCQGVNVQCSQVQLRSNLQRSLTWSECLLAVLAQVSTPLVLYLQEDYFLERTVNNRLILDMAEIMLADSSIAHIGLTNFGTHGPFEDTSDKRLWKITRDARYRVCTQAGLWRTASLQSYLLPHENGWMFEIFGTRRARLRNERFLTLNRDLFGAPPASAIQYIHTGIVKGRWHPAVQSLFARYGINVDYGKRGFHKQLPWPIPKIETALRLIGKPSAVLRSLASR
jgi:hypothetical protein